MIKQNDRFTRVVRLVEERLEWALFRIKDASHKLDKQREVELLGDDAVKAALAHIQAGYDALKAKGMMARLDDKGVVTAVLRNDETLVHKRMTLFHEFKQDEMDSLKNKLMGWEGKWEGGEFSRGEILGRFFEFLSRKEQS